MDPKDKSRLRINHTLLVSDLEARHVIDDLLSSGTITDNEMEEILNTEPKTRRTRNSTLLLILTGKGPDAYGAFYSSLDPNGFQHIREALDKTEIPQAPDDWFAALPSENQTSVPSDKQLASIAKAVGVGWEVIGMLLGLSQPEIEHCKLRHPNVPLMQIVTMFTKWKSKSGRRATMKVLAAALSDTSVYDGVFKTLLTTE